MVLKWLIQLPAFYRESDEPSQMGISITRGFTQFQSWPNFMQARNLDKQLGARLHRAI